MDMLILKDTATKHAASQSPTEDIAAVNKVTSAAPSQVRQQDSELPS